ncbi:DUF6979 family protein [Aeromonas sp. Y318-1]|uniref:DUF6979 family protein n=1 Tax=Aeromonas TaxID=642 RepID=UPI0022DFCB7E|nr:hypothetical protein [Aeromonas sp. Y318-1]
MIIYGKYGGVALRAVYLMAKNNCDHITAWDTAISEAFGSDLTVKKFKNNPKVTFLTLCSMGVVSCVMPIAYNSAKKTRKYVTIALSILSQKDISTPINPDDLWSEIIRYCEMEKAIKHNNQMDVVLTLWYANILTVNHPIRNLKLNNNKI